MGASFCNLLNVLIFAKESTHYIHEIKALANDTDRRGYRQHFVQCPGT